MFSPAFSSSGKLLNCVIAISLSHTHSKEIFRSLYISSQCLAARKDVVPSPSGLTAKKLGLKEDQFQKLTTDYPEVVDYTYDELMKSVHNLHNSKLVISKGFKEIRDTVVSHHPWFLLFRPSFTRSRIKWYHEQISKQFLANEVPRILPLLFAQPLKKTKYFLNLYEENPYHSSLAFLEDWQERLSFLSHHLEVTRFEVVSIGKVLHPVIMTREFELIKDITLLLKDNGLTSVDLLNDLHIYKNNIDLMRTRIQHLKDINAIHTLKTWMLRAPDKIIDRSFAIREVESKILGDKDRIQYLVDRLKVKREDVERTVQKYPFILGVNAPKLESLITFMLSMGYSGWEILCTPRCFQYSLEVLKERHRQLTSFVPKPDFHYLSLDQKKYQNVYRRMRQQDM